MHAAKSYCTYPGNCRLSIAGSPSYWASTSQWSPQHPCPLLCPGMRMCSLCTPTKQAHSAGPATNYGELAAGTARAAALQRCSAARPPRCATARRATRCRRARRLASAPARLLTLDLTSIFSHARRRQAVSLVRRCGWARRCCQTRWPWRRRRWSRAAWRRGGRPLRARSWRAPRSSPARSGWRCWRRWAPRLARCRARSAPIPLCWPRCAGQPGGPDLSAAAVEKPGGSCTHSNVHT